MFYFIKCMAHTPLIVSVFDKDEEDFGSLARNATSKAYLGIILGHFFLFVVCTVTLNFFIAGVNFIFFILGLVNSFYISKLTNMKKVLKEDNTVSEREFTAEHFRAWQEMYRHPVDKAIRQLQAKKNS